MAIDTLSIGAEMDNKIRRRTEVEQSLENIAEQIKMIEADLKRNPSPKKDEGYQKVLASLQASQARFLQELESLK